MIIFYGHSTYKKYCENANSWNPPDPGLLVLPLELLSLETVGKKTMDTGTLFFPLDFRGVPATV